MKLIACKLLIRPAEVWIRHPGEGVQMRKLRQHWIPAFAGMTVVSYFIGPEQ
jgi:hypothetical protein